MRTTDKRGSSKDRARRKAYLLRTFSCCVWCTGELTPDNVHADRIFAGGTYARHNIIASCAPCNMSRKDKPAHVYLALRKAPAHAHKILQEMLKHSAHRADV